MQETLRGRGLPTSATDGWGKGWKRRPATRPAPSRASGISRVCPASVRAMPPYTSNASSNGMPNWREQSTLFLTSVPPPAKDIPLLNQ